MLFLREINLLNTECDDKYEVYFRFLLIIGASGFSGCFFIGR